jgi:hypothetical protein
VTTLDLAAGAGLKRADAETVLDPHRVAGEIGMTRAETMVDVRSASACGRKSELGGGDGRGVGFYELDS